MPLESTNNVDGLVSNNPLDNDPWRQGAAHLRLIKQVLKSTFPGLSGAFGRTQSRNSSFTLSQSDRNSRIEITDALEITLPSPGSVGNGWAVELSIESDTVDVITNGNNVNGSAADFSPSNGVIYTLVSTGAAFLMHSRSPDGGDFPSGTRMAFQQSVAPAGWTRETDSAYNNAAFRASTGDTAFSGTGGSSGFDAVFASGRSTNNHALTISQLPSHSHGNGSLTAAGAGAHSHRLRVGVLGSPGSWGSSNSILHGDPSIYNDDLDASSTGKAGVDTQSNHTHNITGSTAASGSGGSHSHGLPTFAVRYVGLIIAQKD